MISQINSLLSSTGGFCNTLSSQAYSFPNFPLLSFSFLYWATQLSALASKILVPAELP